MGKQCDVTEDYEFKAGRLVGASFEYFLNVKLVASRCIALLFCCFRAQHVVGPNARSTVYALARTLVWESKFFPKKTSCHSISSISPFAFLRFPKFDLKIRFSHGMFSDLPLRPASPSILPSLELLFVPRIESVLH